MRENGKINVKILREKNATGSDFKFFFPAILRFGFVDWAPIQVVTNTKWEFVSMLGPVSMQNRCHLLQCVIYGVGDRLRTSQKRGLFGFCLP